MLVQNDDGSAGGKGWSTDVWYVFIFSLYATRSDGPIFVSVPASKLPQLVYETKKDLQDSGILSTIVGHIGDGNFHALLLFKNEEELVPVRAAVHRMVERAIALDGTCSYLSRFVWMKQYINQITTFRHGGTWCWSRKERIPIR